MTPLEKERTIQAIRQAISQAIKAHKNYLHDVLTLDKLDKEWKAVEVFYGDQPSALQSIRQISPLIAKTIANIHHVDSSFKTEFGCLDYFHQHFEATQQFVDALIDLKRKDEAGLLNWHLNGAHTYPILTSLPIPRAISLNDFLLKTRTFFDEKNYKLSPKELNRNYFRLMVRQCIEATESCRHYNLVMKIRSKNHCLKAIGLIKIKPTKSGRKAHLITKTIETKTPIDQLRALSSYDTGMSGKGWKIAQTHASVLAYIGKKPLEYDTALHHGVSKSALTKLYKHALTTIKSKGMIDKSNPSKPFFSALIQIGYEMGLCDTSFQLRNSLHEVLLCAPFNLFLGPEGIQRIDEPGDYIDISLNMLAETTYHPSEKPIIQINTLLFLLDLCCKNAPSFDKNPHVFWQYTAHIMLMSHHIFKCSLPSFPDILFWPEDQQWDTVSRTSITSLQLYSRKKGNLGFFMMRSSPDTHQQFAQKLEENIMLENSKQSSTNADSRSRTPPHIHKGQMFSKTGPFDRYRKPTPPL